MNFIFTLVANQIFKSVTSWQTTALAGWSAYLVAILTNSGLIDPQYIHGLSGQIAQWSLGAVSLLLLAWQDRKQDNTPTKPPVGD